MSDKGYFKGLFDGVRVPMDFLLELKEKLEYLSELDGDMMAFDGDLFINVSEELSTIAEKIDDFHKRTYRDIGDGEVRLFNGEVVQFGASTSHIDTSSILRELDRRILEQQLEADED